MNCIVKLVACLAAALMLTEGGAQARFAFLLRTGGQGSGGPPPQTIVSIPLAGTTFAPGSSSGTVVGTIGTVIMSPSSPPFVGTVTVDDTTDFQIVGSNLETNGTPCPSGPCSFPINLIATGSYSNSPHSTPYTITAGTTTNVASVQITNENVPPASAAATLIGDLSAKVTGGGACTTCTWTFANSGPPTGQSVPACFSGYNNFFQIVNVGDGTAHFETLTTGVTTQNFGPAPATEGMPCVTATPTVGTPYTFAFTVMVRGPVMTSVSPRKIQYTPGTAKTVPLTTTICWTDCKQGGSPPTPTFTLGGDASCVAAGISISGANLTLSSSYAGAGVCHITAAAAGVTCQTLGAASATPTTCIAAVDIEQAPYVGPGDVMTWTVFTGPYAYSAAYAAAGGPVWKIVRESDQALLTVNILPNGDMDLDTMAAFCDTSICYVSTEADQSGSSPANDLHAWADLAGNGSPLTAWRPVVVFNAINGVMVGESASNAQDRLMQNFTTYNGSGATGTLWVSGLQFSPNSLRSSMLDVNQLNSGSTNETDINVLPTTGAELYIGPNNDTGGTSITASASPGVWHSMLGVVNGASSIFKVDGVVNTGTLMTASLIRPYNKSGGYGGGAITGNMGGGAVSSTVATLSQLTTFCKMDQANFGTAGSC